MKTFSRITPSLLVVVMLVATLMPAEAQTHKPTTAAAVLRPNAVDDAETTAPGTPLTIPVLANDTDPQNLPLSVVAVSAPTNGTATTNGTTILYTPIPSFSGIDTFTYTVSNGTLTNTAFVDAIVLPPPGSIWENDVFDPLTLGSLAGQSGWSTVSGQASPVVITDLDPNRGKTVQIDAASGQAISVTKDVPDQSNGRNTFSFFVKVSGTTHESCETAIEIQTDPSTGWTNKARFCIGNSITVNYDPNGAATTIVPSTVAGQWYFIQGEMDLNANLLNAWVNGSLVASGIPLHPGPVRSLGITGQDQGSAGVVFVDDLTGASSYATTGVSGGIGTPGRPVYWINSAGGLWSEPANWSTRSVPTTSDHAIITLGGTYTVTVDGSASVGSLTLGAGSGVQTLWIKGNSRGSHVTLTVNNDILNSSVIRLESESAGYQSNLTTVNGVLINTHTINAALGSSGPRIITGQVLNHCRVNVQHDLTCNGTFTNHAILDISEGKQMSLNGSAPVFNQNGGYIGGNGLLTLSNGATMNFNRGATTGSNPPTLTNAKLNFGAGATGVATLIMQGQGATNAPSQLSGDIGAEQTVWIRGNGQGGQAIITAPNGFVNAGIIRLESQIANYQSDLTIASGALTNTGVININRGTSGSRNITGTLVNEGAVNVNWDATFKGTFTNFGALAIDSLRTMSLVTNTDVFNQNAGTIAGKGVLFLGNGATMNFNSGATAGSAPTLTNAKLNFGPAATGVATFIMQGQGATNAPSQLSGDIGAEQTVWIRGNGQGGHAIVTAPNGFVNAGVIRLESQIANYQSDLTIASGALTNTGVININRGTSGSRNLTGTLVNEGAVNVNWDATFKGTFTNFGALAIDSLRTMSLAANTDVFNQNAGTIAGKGVLFLGNGATMNFNSGATTGSAPTLTNAKLNFGPAATGVATFIMQGQGATNAPSQLSGDIGAEQTVWIRGNGQGGHAIITAPNGFVNAGVIRLESQVSSFQSDLTIASGALTNTGIININRGTNGSRNLTGTLVNQGAVNVNWDAIFKGTFTNLGILTIDSLRTMSLAVNTDVFNQNAGMIAGKGLLELSNGATMNFNSGTTTGSAPTLTNAKLNFGPAATGVATFIMQGQGATNAPSQLSGDIGVEQTVWIRGNGQGGHAIITAPNGFVNAGVIRLESQVSSYQSDLTIASGALINTGMISINRGTSGSRIITGALVNQGAVNVNYNLNFNGSFTNRDTLTIASTQSLIATGPLFRNDSSGVIRGSGTLNVFNTLGKTFINAGAISPDILAGTPGTLTITGNCRRTATSALNIEIGGTASNQFDLLQVSGADTLNGSLNISLINNFTPALGNTFRILTYGSRSGVFATVNGGDLGNKLRFKVNYNATNVTLEVAPEGVDAPILASPPNGGRRVSRTPILTWNSSFGASQYQLQLSLTADFSATVIKDTTVSGISCPVGPLIPNRVYYWRVRAENILGTSDWSEVWSFIPEVLPDLQVAAVNAPPSAFSGSTIQIQWTVTNSGETGSNAPKWFDRLYLSPNPTFDLQTATVLGTYENLSYLAPAESYVNSASVTLPQGIVGDHYIFVWTDVNGQAPEAIETNNAGRNTIPIQVNLTPTPDLQITTLIMPHEAFSGDSITVQWTVTNLGTAPTEVNQWADAVFLSPDSVLNFDYQVHPPNTILFRDPQFASVPHSGTLAVSNSYSASTRFALPRLNHGKYWLFVYTDMRTKIPELESKAKERGDVYEYVQDFNNTREDIINITLAPLPDLIVTTVTSTDSASTNQPVTVSWQVQNVGLAPTFESLWSDQVFISQSPTFQSSSVQALAAFDHSGVLRRDSSYAGSGTVTIPPGYAGPAYFYVKTDWRNHVFEYSDSTPVDTGNVNRNGRRITALPPDLFTTNVTIPEAGNSGTTTTLQWTVRNLGPGTLVKGTWHDRVYLSRLAVFNADSSVVLGSFTRSGTLGKDSVYTASGNVTLPNGIQGPFYVYVKADWENRIFENNVEDNNLRRSDATFQINLSPWPDLQPTITSVLTNAVAGQQVQMTWQVRNAGTAPTQTTSWIDRLYLSTQTTLDSATAVGSVAHTGLLAPAGSYTAASLVTLPPNLGNGTYYLFVKTDADTAVFEHTDEGNNIARSNGVAVSAYPPVDLRVSTIAAPGSGQSGQSIALQVTVENIGAGRTLASGWTDDVYLSADSLLNENIDTRLLRIGHTGALDGGKSYTLNRSVVLPNGSSGTYYVFVKTDADNQVNDISRSNNVRSSLPIAITLTPSADLVVDSLAVPTRTTAGQPITLRWRIGNHGNGRTNSPTWYEAVYLSADSVIDKSDTRLGTYRRDGGLDAASSYTDTMRVELPAYVAGPHFLILKADNNDDVYEHNAENNNTRARIDTLLLAPPADLIVSRVDVPGSAVPGESITVSWTIRNIGSNPAVGWLRDAVYISPDTIWQVADPLVGVDYRFINLAPHTSQAISKRVNLAEAFLADSIGNAINPLPGVTPGAYHVIVRTNIRNNIREVTLANNVLASQDTVAVDLPTLVAGIPSTGALAEGQMRYFKITVTANLDLRLRLTSNVDDASNEMYVAYNRVPTFNDYDVAGTAPLSAGQEIIVASTRQGTYYILLFSRAAPAKQTFSLTATLLSFSISEVTPDHGGTGGQVTSTVYGAGFRDSTRFVLKSGSSQLVQGKLLRLVNTTQAKVRWDLVGAPLGTYDVMAINSDGSIAMRAEGFNVEPLRAGQVATFFDGPSVLRLGAVSTFSVRFVNNSNVDVPYLPIRLVLRGNAKIESINWTEEILNLHHLDTTSTCTDCAKYIVLRDSPDGSQYTVVDLLAKDVHPLREHQVTLQVRPLVSDSLGLYASYQVLGRNAFEDIFFATAFKTRNEILSSDLPDPVKSFVSDSTAFVQFLLNRFSQIGLLEPRGGLFALSKREASFDLGHVFSTEHTTAGFFCTNCETIISALCSSVLGYFGCPLVCSPLSVLPPAYVVCNIACAIGFSIWCTGEANIICHSWCTPTVRPHDPNDITGPPGFGTQGWVQRTQEMPYTIRFENDPLLATAPAQTVTVTQTLDTTIDIRTFRLGAFGFGSFVFNPPANVAHYSSRLDVSDSLGVFVDVVAGVDVPANRIFWTFRSIDPVTSLPPTNPLAGFLPVEDSLGHGQGFVNYTIRPKSTTHTGDVINAQASIVFDVNNPIVTPSIFNTIDADVPVSSMIPPAIRITETSYRLRWAGGDVGSGIAGYTIYASHQDSAFVPWISNTTDTSAIFTGIPGDRYRFYSIATDGAGNVGIPSEPLVITGVEEKQIAPTVFALSNNYPNPFNPLTAINYDVPRKSLVTIKIYNIFGQEVYTLVNEEKDAGRYTATWNGINNQNLAVASGVYLIRMKAADFVQVKKMMVLK